MIIAQPRELIAQFVADRQKMKEPWSGNFTALGLVRREFLIAGVIYNNFEAANVCMHIGAIEGQHWLTREFLHAMFDYPFNQLGKRRATACIPRKKKNVAKFAANLGFKYEGCIRHYYEQDDMVLYGLLRENCRWIVQPEKARMAA